MAVTKEVAARWGATDRNKDVIEAWNPKTGGVGEGGPAWATMRRFRFREVVMIAFSRG